MLHKLDTLCEVRGTSGSVIIHTRCEDRVAARIYQSKAKTTLGEGEFAFAMHQRSSTENYSCNISTKKSGEEYPWSLAEDRTLVEFIALHKDAQASENEWPAMLAEAEYWSMAARYIKSAAGVQYLRKVGTDNPTNKGYTVQTTINGSPCAMEVDIAADYSIMSEITLAREERMAKLFKMFDQPRKIWGGNPSTEPLYCGESTNDLNDENESPILVPSQLAKRSPATSASCVVIKAIGSLTAVAFHVSVFQVLVFQMLVCPQVLEAPFLLSFSDASNVACGAYLVDTNKVSHRMWSPCKAAKSSTWKELNACADEISNAIDFDDWCTTQGFFAHLDSIWGPHTVDRFAKASNAHLSRFYSRFRVLGSKAVDAFSVKWTGENNCRDGSYKFRGSDALSYSRACEIVFSAFEAIGLPRCDYGLHSLRAGGASAAANAHITDRLFKRHGRWKSD
ncbi:hypothetical protein ACROYT_G004343 [Oculina patagonica]